MLRQAFGCSRKGASTSGRLSGDSERLLPLAVSFLALPKTCCYQQEAFGSCLKGKTQRGKLSGIPEGQPQCCNWFLGGGRGIIAAGFSFIASKLKYTAHLNKVIFHGKGGD